MSKTHNGVIINSFTLKARVAEQQHMFTFSLQVRTALAHFVSKLQLI